MSGVRVIDAATLLAGPLIATMFGDHGADVIKVEQPSGDPLRRVGAAKDDVSLYWKIVSRNKRVVTLDLGTERGSEVFLRLCEDADVVIENFRPGTFERWGLGWERLREVNPRLVMVRVTGFGQEGPYASRPAFGTVVEATTGWASLNGDPEGPPMLPPPGLADGVCGMAGAWATAFALYHRDVHDGGGQVVDLALYEPLLMIQGPHLTVYDQLGVVPRRTGNRSQTNAPRNTYQTSDGVWVAVATSSDRTARDALCTVGHPEVTKEEWFRTGQGRVARAELLDELVGRWIRERPAHEVLTAFTEAKVPAAAINDIPQVIADPHLRHRGSLVSVADAQLGNVVMQGSVGRFSGSSAGVRWAGRPPGADNDAVLGDELGIGRDELAELARLGVIAQAG